ncbi:MAG TPA: 6-phosphogluconolactonase [Verrucomicrobiae bacterium]
MKKFELISFATPDDLARAVASQWLDEIEAANRAGQNHCVALSGGRITHKFFASTVEQSRERKTSFARVHFFWADERCLPPDDPESNYKMANELLFVPLQIPEKQIHRILGEAAPEIAVQTAEKQLLQLAKSSENQPVIDLVLLGMGEDGHVASLFQNAKPISTNDAKCKESFLFVADSPKPPPCRISLTFNAIALAKAVWVLASGSGKETALRDSLAEKGQTPLGKVIASRKNTKIFSDIRAGA